MYYAFARAANMKSYSSSCHFLWIASTIFGFNPGFGLVQESESQGKNSITVTIVDDLGKPLPDVSIRRNYLYTADGDETPQVDDDFLQTDNDGKARIRINGSPVQLLLHVHVDGFVPMYALWKGEQFRDEKFPDR